ncbi:MAG: hypothetical protein CVV58_04940 [Tenericutes bacterium HGW-Tenericutes-3]|nr:MAG: hypothetical protein CVV58_04940 [Tenericutes bacterium HGW-Tenericutes-3]
MKSTILKIVVSVIVVSIAAIFTYQLRVSNQATTNGSLEIVIIDQQGNEVFNDEISYEIDDSFFDILNRNFELTCATASYGRDETCSYNFTGFAYEGKVLLGIKNDDFTVQTNWSTSFLKFEIYDENGYHLTTQGVSHIEFSNHDKIRISYASVLEGLS